MDKLLKVYAPAEPEEEYRRLDVKDAFVLNTISAQTELKIGGIRITFAPMKHPSMDFAVAMESDGRKFVFSGIPPGLIH